MRQHPRKLGTKSTSDPACIKIGQDFYPCSIKEISLAGANLRLGKAMELPARFKLLIGRMSFGCSLTWREHVDVDVMFEVDEAQPQQPSEPIEPADLTKASSR
jgi:hypothetical protein